MISEAIQPEQLAYAVGKAGENLPRRDEEEGTILVVVSPVNTEGANNFQMRFCNLGWDYGRAVIIEGSLPHGNLPNKVTFAPGLEWVNPNGGPATLKIHQNGTLHVTAISDPTDEELALLEA